MARQDIQVHPLDNGMTLVTEAMPEVMSAAFVFLLPAGVVYDPPGHTGTMSVLSELVYRGAGPYDNRELNDRLDALGLHRHSSIATTHATFGGSLIHDKLHEALRLHALMLRQPTLDDRQFEISRELTLQSLASLDDEPQQKVSLLALEQYLPDPFGRPAPGKADEVSSLSAQTIRGHWAGQFTPRGTILAVAGKFDLHQLKKHVEELFGDWDGLPVEEPAPADVHETTWHEDTPGSQVHVAICYPSAPFRHADYYAALAAAGVLSGGMGSRLFTEVREKRGLCYAVGAAHRVYGPFGVIRCYLGSSPDRVQQALDVTIGELRRLGQGIEPDELERAKVGLRSSLVMQGESTGARALACASDQAHLGRVRPLPEIEQGILSLAVQDVVDHVQRFPAERVTVASLGPKQVTLI